ncbi:hypothetical protein D9M68_956260 [compost metagenome]
MNQHALAWADIGAIHQAFPCRDKHQRQCGSLAHAECVRFGRDQPGIDSDVFGHGALGTADPAGHTEDFFARCEPFNRLSQFDDRTGQIQAEHCR